MKIKSYVFVIAYLVAPSQVAASKIFSDLDVAGVKIGQTTKETVDTLAENKPNLGFTKKSKPKLIKLGKNENVNVISGKNKNEYLMVGYTLLPGEKKVTFVSRLVAYNDKPKPKFTDFKKSIVSKYGEPTIVFSDRYIWVFNKNGRQIPPPVSDLWTADKNIQKKAARNNTHLFSCWSNPMATSNIKLRQLWDLAISSEKISTKCKHSKVFVMQISGKGTDPSNSYVSSYGARLFDIDLLKENNEKWNKHSATEKEKEFKKKQDEAIINL